MIYKVEQTVILDNGKIYPNMFYVLDKDLTDFLKYITSDDENVITYTYVFSNKFIRMYEKVSNRFKWQEFKISATDETLVAEDELYLPDYDDYQRGKFITDIQEIMFKEIDSIDSLNKVMKKVSNYLSK